MRKNIIYILGFLALTFSTSSCLKDDLGEDWTDSLAGKMYAQIMKPGFQVTGLNPIPASQEFEFMVNIATDALPSSAITLTVAVDEPAIAKYNAAHGTDYKLYPYITILTPSITIPAGSRTGTIKVSVTDADKLSACDNFFAPISITSVTGGVVIASNMKTVMMAMPIANPYQGLYNCTGVFSHPTAGNRDIDEEKDLSTVDCKTVATTVGDLGGYQVTFTVNADNSVTIGGAVSASQPCIPVPGKPNYYDPATKSFHVNYQYTGGGGFRVIQEDYVLVTK
jgi:hypothetical protein